MDKKQRVSICSTIGMILIMFFLLTAPAMALPGEKIELRQDSDEKSIVERDGKNDRDGKKVEDKAKKKVKRKVVKNVGTAATVGIVSKKVTSEIKESIKGDSD